MTNEEQRAAIGKACGMANRWVLKKRGLFYRPNANGYTNNVRDAWIVSEAVADLHTYRHDEPVTKYPAPLPDYLNDLNAMYSAEATLTPDQGGDYEEILEDIAQVALMAEGSNHWLRFKVAHATAAQRAEAFLKCLNLWRDETPKGA